MQYTTLGKTGLRVSVAGLGSGGFSKIGQGTGRSEAESIAIVHQALDLGINFIDTAAAYGTEVIIGKALVARNRDDVVISTKASVGRGADQKSARDVAASLDQSLTNLGVDCIDVFHLHGVPPDGYSHAVDTLVPALLKEREKGKFRHLGITEVPPLDPYHEPITKAVQTDLFEVIMIAYHMLHQSAQKIFTTTRKKGIGVLNMFAVRVLFSEKGRLKRVVDELAKEGRLPAELMNEPDPLGFLIHDAGARNIIDAAYRYCRHTEGTDVILFGTGNPDHVKANIDSILAPPLPDTDVKELESLFGELLDVGLDAPGNVKQLR
jgi:aryl-alcohol dehydrogenase-like predicted oxidoreductase